MSMIPQTSVVDNPNNLPVITGTRFVQLAALRGAVSLEIKGLRMGASSPSKVAKHLYGLKGSKQTILDQLNEMIELAHVARAKEVQAEAV